MTVRPARRDEAGDIAELWEELVEYHHQIDPNLPVATSDGVERYAYFIMDRIDRTDSIVVVAIDDQGRVVGYALAFIIELVPEMFVQQRAGFLADVYVQPSARRQGHGRALYGAIVDWCQTNGLQTLEWEVAAANTTGRAFWQAMGGSELMIRLRRTLDHDRDD